MLGDDGREDLVAHAAGLQAEFRALHAYVEDAPTRLDGRLGAAEERLDGALAYRGLVRYDAYNEMCGRQSTSIALLDARALGRRALVDPPPRPGAALRQAGRPGPAATLQLSPEEEEAVRVALGRRAGRRRGPAPDARRPSSARRAPSPRRRSARAAGAGAGGRARALPDDPRRRSRRCSTATVDRGARADRELARGRRQRDPRRARRRRRGVAVVGELSCRSATASIAREPLELGDDHGRALASAGARRSARASCASELPGPAFARPPRPPRPSARSSRPTRAWAAHRPARRRRAPRRRRPARGRRGRPRQRDAVRVGGRAPGAPPGGRAARPGRRRWSSRAPATARPGWLVRCLSEFAFRGVNLVEDRVAAAPVGARALRLPRRLRGPGRRGGRRATRSTALHAHCEDVRVLGSYPAAS